MTAVRLKIDPAFLNTLFQHRCLLSETWCPWGTAAVGGEVWAGKKLAGMHSHMAGRGKQVPILSTGWMREGHRVGRQHEHTHCHLLPDHFPDQEIFQLAEM